MKLPNILATTAILGSLALAPTANAMLLVGWHDFDGTTNDEAPDFIASGFSGNLVKSLESRELGGDIGDGSGQVFYGDSNIASGPGNDGVIRMLPNAPTLFTLTNNSGSSIPLVSFLFDATSAGGSVINISYRIGSDALQLLGSFSGITATGSNTADPLLAQNFSDLSQSLIGITLGNTETITFSVDATGGNGVRLDNIAITAIPEPGNILALGLLLSSGLLLRTRQNRPLDATAS